MSCLPFPTPVSTGSGSKGLISGRFSATPRRPAAGGMLAPVRDDALDCQRMQLPPLRAVYYLLGAKWCLAIALLFALTLPITTCQARGKVQEHHVEIAGDSEGLILCFVWPPFVLVPRTFWRRMRLAYQLPIAECICVVFAQSALVIHVVGMAIVSFGSIEAGSGYQLASSSLLGYFALSLFDFGVLFANRRR
jgi:hypothetical protein